MPSTTAWGGQGFVRWHAGLDPTAPAMAPDGGVGIGGVAAATGVASDGASGHSLVAWAQEDSGSNDGYYALDTSGGSPVKEPGTGSNSLAHFSPFANLAVSGRQGAAGVYVAGCDNESDCHLQLWQVGSPRVLRVPDSVGASSVSLHADQAGRLWLAWYDEAKSKVRVVRTNRAATKLGSAVSVGAPCLGHGLMGLAGGTDLVVGLQCLDKATGTLREYVTLVNAALTLNVAPHSVRRGGKVTVTVTDAGQPVKHATVRFNGQKRKTNGKGKAILTVRAGGKVRVTASGYATAQAGSAFRLPHHGH